MIATWDEKTEVLPGVMLHRIGGHFPAARSFTLWGLTVAECC